MPASAPRARHLAAWGVLAAALVVSAVSFWLVRTLVQREAAARFEAQATDTAARIQARLLAYEAVLDGLRALMMSRPEVSRGDFRRYVETLDLPQRYPAILTANFARRVLQAEKARYEAAVRADSSRDPGGYPGFAIYPPGERDEYLVIDYIEPFDEPGRNATFGRDVYGVQPHAEQRIRASELARDSGLPYSSGRPIDDPRVLATPVLGVRLAVYRAGAPIDTVVQRRAAFSGSVGYALSINHLLEVAIGQSAARRFDLRLEDAGPVGVTGEPASEAFVLFDSHDPDAPAGHAMPLQAQRELAMAGRRWRLEFTDRAPPDMAATLLVWGTLLGGACIGLLLFSLVRSLESSRQVAVLREREAQLAAHRDALEQQVHERTLQLQAAKERAEAASEAKTGFLTRMSHELRTPLNAVLGYAQLLQMDPALGARQRHGVDTIRLSGEHLLGLVNDILDLARIEAGKAELLPAPLWLAPFLQGVADIARVKIEEKGVAFAVEIDPALPPGVLADEQRLRQVLLNLLGNAAKFTDHGQVRLAVRRDVDAPPEAEGRVAIAFSVEDSGVGIGPEHLESIFQPFEQAGEARRRAGGSGLGLAITRQLLRLMGSDIAVHSTPGAGSRFAFTLRLPALTAVASA
ncbi:CHASE domain-containing protein [Aquabacterium sp.]|uniref:CHASE domain-containing protein n=1 Tax=Aquabacterium sp. TaxID=1872578 RepID=UPI0037845FC7